MINTIIHIEKGQANKLFLDVYEDSIDKEGNLFATMRIFPERGEIKLIGGFVPITYAKRIQKILMEMQDIKPEDLPENVVNPAYPAPAGHPIPA